MKNEVVTEVEAKYMYPLVKLVTYFFMIFTVVWNFGHAAFNVPPRFSPFAYWIPGISSVNNQPCCWQLLDCEIEDHYDWFF